VKHPRVRRAGFTLLELLAVLAILSVLASLAVPAFELYIRRARTAEVRALLESIAHAQLGYKRDNGRYIACAANPKEVPRAQEATFDRNRAGWKELGFSVDAPVRYQYEVRVDSANVFSIVALGDLDGDGTQSRFELRGDSLRVNVENELE